MTAQLRIQSVAASCSVETPLALARGPPVNTSGETNAGLGVGGINDNFQCTRQQSALINSIGSCVHMHGYIQ